MRRTPLSRLEAAETLVDLVRGRADEAPDARAYTFLVDGEEAQAHLTYAELDTRARAMAAALQGRGITIGDRALLLFSGGLDFVTAFLGCLYAGVTPVPCHPPRQAGARESPGLERFLSIAADAVPAAVLADERIAHGRERGQADRRTLDSIPWLSPAAVPDHLAGEWKEPRRNPTGLALLQYTSGSVDSPKGVMVTHHNLLSNLRMLAIAADLPDDVTFVSWLPFHHDMGLIGITLGSLAADGTCVLMSPLHFLQRPVRWLRAIARQPAVVSGGPNFAYDLCVRRVSPEQRQGLDLSSWVVAFNGAEPVRHSTLDGFAGAYADQGFRPEAWFPTYGLAEATLLAAGGARGGLSLCSVDADALERGRALDGDGSERTRTLVTCGAPAAGGRLLIVDPETRRPCGPSHVGEIWIQGPHVAAGYWNRAEETEATFGGRLAEDESGPFLRTGDLGFLDGGQVIVTGRMKDLIIVRGRNLYPQDVEIAAELAHPASMLGFAAAFSVEVGDEERLVVMQAVRPGGDLDHDEVIARIRQAVTSACDVDVHAVLLVRPTAILRTTSGKVRRRACREAYLESSIDAIATSVRMEPLGATEVDTSDVHASAAAGIRASLLAASRGRERRTLVETLLRDSIARALDVDPVRVDLDSSLPELGLDSLRSIELWHVLERQTGVSLPIDLLAGGAPTAATLADAIAERLEGDAGPDLPAAIPHPAARWEPFPLTDLQRAYLAGRGDALALGGVATHVYLEVESEALDLPRLERAWQQVVERHDMLRAVVLPDGWQRVLPEVPPYRIEVLDLGLAPNEVEARLADLRARLSHEIRPTEAWPLFDIRATLLPGGCVRLHLGLDMLIADVWSCRLLLIEWAERYRAPDTEMAPLDLSFRDHVLAEARIQETERYERARRYWLDRLASIPSPPQLPLRPTAERASPPRFVRRTALLEAEVWRQIKARGARAGLTPSTLVLTAFARTLAAWSTGGQFTLDVTLFNRAPLHPRVNHIVGDFTSVNLLVLDMTDPAGMLHDADAVRRQLWRDLEHRWFSGVRVLRELARARGVSAAPIPVVFTSALGQGGRDGDDLPTEWLGRTVHGISQTPQVWLDHHVLEMESNLVLNWDAADAIFPAGMIDDMFRTYQRYLRALAMRDDLWTSDSYDWLPEGQQACRAAVNDTAAPVPNDLLHSGFLRQASLAPERLALIAGDRTLTYGELASRARHVAGGLRAEGVRPGELVAVSMSKGWGQVAAVLGVHLAGAAYLPVDPDLPAERRAHLVTHAGARVVLVESESDGEASTGWPDAVTGISFGGGEPVGTVPDDLAGITDPDDLAYVIYTSGSTGLPKGVAISHRSALNTILDVNRRFAVGPEDRVLGLSSLSFDLSVYDIFGTLAAGGALVLPEPEASRDPGRWQQLLEAHGVTIWNSVPALMQMLVEHAEAARPSLRQALRLVMLSGDWIPLPLPDRVRALWPRARVVSLGGATEAAIWSICHPVESVDPSWESVPYGRPMDNQWFEILDERMQHRPVWVPGQLHIGGIGLARCYWRDHERTRASFVTRPDNGERLYRTGDLGRYLPDGTIEFLGRADTQVKVGGFRIELGEVESALALHPDVVASAVVAVGDRHNRRLVACIVPRRTPAAGRWTAVWTIPGPSDEELVERMRHHLEGKLPSYMVPTGYLLLDALPLTSNGKVNRHALTEAASRENVRAAHGHRSTTSGGGGGTATGRTERQLAALVAEVLGVEQVEPTDNLFDLGLDSLSAARLGARIREAFGVAPPYRQIFESPMVASLARVIDTPSAEAVTFDSDELLADVCLDPAVTVPASASNHSEEPARLLITGATGFVGSFLLASLLQMTRCEVRCLVRTADAALGRRRIIHALQRIGVDDEVLLARVHVVPGDLGRPRLGLDEKSYAELAAGVDAIYHCGALVNFLYPYRRLRATNVVGTQEVIRLACTDHVKAVHHISSTAVFPIQMTPGTVLREIDLDPVPARLETGYARSKWVSERIAALARERGVPVTIYRPGQVSGDSRLGIWATNDVVCHIIRACVEIGGMPDLAMSFDLVPVDYVSAAIALLARRQEARNRVFHLTNQCPVTLADMLDGLQRAGYPVCLLSWDRWIERLGELARGGEEVFYPLIALLKSWEQGRSQGLVEPGYGSDATLEVLGNSLRCPAVDADLFVVYLAQLAREGFIPAPAAVRVAQ